MDKNHVLAIGTFGIFAVVVSFLFAADTLATPTSSSGFDNWIKLEVCHSDGSCEKPVVAKNIVTTQGLNHTRDLLSGTGITGISNWTFLELSDNAGAVTGDERECPSERISESGLGTSIANVTRNEAGSGNYTAEIFYLVSGTQTVRTVCFGNDTTQNNTGVMALTVLPSNVNVQNGDTLNITYSIAAVNS